MSGLSSSAQKLTMAQIYVLRRMASGTVYDISGNFRRARERRTFMGNPDDVTCRSSPGHCCKVSDEAAFCLIQRPYISKTLLTRRISPRGSP